MDTVCAVSIVPNNREPFVCHFIINNNFIKLSNGLLLTG